MLFMIYIVIDSNYTAKKNYLHFTRILSWEIISLAHFSFLSLCNCFNGIIFFFHFSCAALLNKNALKPVTSVWYKCLLQSVLLWMNSSENQFNTWKDQPNIIKIWKQLKEILFFCCCSCYDDELHNLSLKLYICHDTQNYFWLVKIP